MKGKLQVTRAVGGQIELLSETEETLKPGKNAVVLEGQDRDCPPVISTGPILSPTTLART